MNSPNHECRPFSPWVYFLPPDQETLTDLTEFLEVINQVVEHRQKTQFAALERKNAAVNLTLGTLANSGISEKGKAIVNELIETTKFSPPSRFTADFELNSIPTNELGIHLRELLHEMENRAIESLDSAAAAEIAKIACSTTLTTSLLERTCPEPIKRVAEASSFWPIARRDAHDNISMQNGRLEQLEVGKNLERIQCKFKELKGPDKNYPGRLWAKRAVRIIENTRWRMILAHDRKMFSVSVMKRFHLYLTEQPAWMRTREFPPFPFTINTVDDWIPVVREVIRHDLPEFHEHSDWTNIRRSLEAAGLETLGKVQNKILDRICDALKQLAPEP